MNIPSSGRSFGNFMVDQRPKFDNAVKKKRRKNTTYQVMGKAGIIRPDKRHKMKFL